MRLGAVTPLKPAARQRQTGPGPAGSWRMGGIGGKAEPFPRGPDGRPDAAMGHPHHGLSGPDRAVIPQDGPRPRTEREAASSIAAISR